MSKPERPLSRREFAHRLAAKAALGTAASLFPQVLPAATVTLSPPAPALPAAAQAGQSVPKLSPQSQAEAESRYQAILQQYPDRFSEEQKTELRRLSVTVQPALDHLRAFVVANGDLPALYLKPLVEREKKNLPAAATPNTNTPAANPAKPASAKP